MTKARFQNLAWATLVATVAVILWGAFVRATGSGAGCGSHWPMCNGEVLPRPKTIQTVIEFTHRLTSGALLVMVVALVVGAFRAYPARHAVRRAATTSLILMLTEAAIGAGIVLLEYVAHDKSVGRAVWMAIHLVNTLLLVGALTCTAYLATGAPAPRLRGQGLVGSITLLGTIGTLAVGVTGAITALGDTLFTATSLAKGIADDLSPAAHFLQQLRVIHPIVAVLVAVFLLYARGAVVARRPSPEVKRFARALGALVVAQLALGFLNVALLAPTWMQLVHLLFADLVWIAFVLLATAAHGREDAAPIGEASAPHGPAGAARAGAA